MSLAPVVTPFACSMPPRHTFSMTSNGLYTRPVICKFCEKVFDFPTLTTDITEKDVPVRTRICRHCLWEMGHNEDLREKRAKAEEAIRRSAALSPERTLPVGNGHKLSMSSVGTNESSGIDNDTAAASTNSPNQLHHHLVARTSQAPAEKRALSEPRRSSNVRDILN